MDGGRITDDGRIRASVPTIRLLTEAGARVIVAAHLGRPKGEVRAELSLQPVADRLGQLLDAPVSFVAASSGPEAAAAVAALPPGNVLVLENVRFDARETSKDETERAALAEQYAALCDLFVSDGFGVVHRKQASVFDVATRRPSYAGRLVAAEMDVLTRLTDDPKRPYAVVLGGSKVSDKLAVIAHLLERVDRMLVGGGMVYTFLAAKGYPTGTSMLEHDQIDTVRGLLGDAAHRGVEIVLPSDIVVADRFAPDARSSVVALVCHSGGHHGARYRSSGPTGVRRCPCRCADGLLERAHGRLRVPGVCGGDASSGAGAERIIGFHRGGRR